MEIKIEEIKALEPIKFNYEELKQQLSEQLKKYENINYTEDTLGLAKTDRATLKKLKDAINAEKIRIKNLVLRNYTESFEPKCKELMEMVETVSEKIDVQIKGFEQKKRDEKLQIITEYFINNVGLYKDLIDFDLIFNEKWLNVTYNIDSIYKEIDHIFAKAKNDLMTINSMVENDEINKQVTDFYFKHIGNSDCLGASLSEAKRIEAMQAKLAEIKENEILQKNVQNVSNNNENVANIPQNETKSIENAINEQKLMQIDFRIWVTKEQMVKLKEFLIENKIKYGKVG